MSTRPTTHGYLREDRSSADAEPTALDACVALAMRSTKLHKLESTPADDPEEREPPSLSHRAVEDTGFNLHAGVRVRDDLARERLCRYALRPAVALSRLRRLRDGCVAYRVKRTHAGKAKHIVLSPIELLARIAALVPPPRYPLVRYHGALAPRSSWRHLVVPKPREPRPCSSRERPTQRTHPPSDANPATSTSAATRPGRPGPSPARVHHLAEGTNLEVQRLAPNVLAVQHWRRLEQGLLYAATPRVDWPRLLRRTFDVDVLKCPRCEGRLRILSIITEQQTLARILPALGLPTDAPILARARDPTDLLELHQEAAATFE